MKKSVKILLILFLIIFFIVAILGVTLYVLFTKATDMSEVDKLNTTASVAIYEPLVKSIIFGEQQEISDDDVNGILATVMETYNQKERSGDISVKGIACYFQDDNKGKVYADVYYKNIRFVLSAVVQINLDSENKEISMDIIETKLGSLAVSKNFVMKQLNKYILNGNSVLNVIEDKVIIPSEYNFTFSGQKITLYLEEVEISNGKALVKTNSAMNIIGNFISDYLKGIISGNT